ncbi:MAG: hypothetical protein M0R06_23300, partial [Sphaerochaeta sp.]|nr:hypothetical protein [Sphaerochaeta sp.]
MPFLGETGYLAVKPQASALVAVLPTTFIPLQSESVVLNPNLTPDRRMKGVAWESDDLLRGALTVAGDIVALADVEALGHLLNMTYAKGVTTGDAVDGYTHPFTPGEGDYYTLEFGMGDYARRVYGAKGATLAIANDDGRLQATVGIVAMGQFVSGALLDALAGAVTSLEFDDSEVKNPAYGLAIGDVLVIGSTEITITNITGNVISFGSTSITASAGDPVYLKAQAVDLTSYVPLSMCGTLVGTGADETAATTAAASRATATPCYDLTLTLDNGKLSANATGYCGPAAILNGTLSAVLAAKRLFETPEQAHDFRHRVASAYTVISTGQAIGA